MPPIGQPICFFAHSSFFPFHYFINLIDPEGPLKAEPEDKEH